MTTAQRADAELLRSLGRPAEVISANTGLSLAVVKDWLRTGRCPGPRQKTLFDRDGLSPRPTTKPATVGHSHGLSLFKQVD